MSTGRYPCALNQWSPICFVARDRTLLPRLGTFIHGKINNLSLLMTRCRSFCRCFFFQPMNSSLGNWGELRGRCWLCWIISPLLSGIVASILSATAIELFNIFDEQDFFFHAASGSVYLKDVPRKRYFSEYERFVTRPMASSDNKSETNFRQLFRRQAERLQQAIMNGETYCPYKLRW